MLAFKDLVPQKLVAATVNGVAPGLGYQVDDAAGESPELRPKAVSLDSKLLRSVLRWD